MKNQLKTLLILGALGALLVAVGGAIGPRYAWLAGAFALVSNVAAYFWSDRIVLAVSRARAVSQEEAPALHEMVTELAARAGIPKPRVFVIDEPHANAFATGRNPEHGAVAVTRGLLDVLSDRELRGVLAHELAHIKNRDILVSSVAAVIAGAVTQIASFLQWGLLLGGGRQSDDGEQGGGGLFGGLAVALVAPIAALLLQFGVSRSREFLADEAGAVISGDPEALASALARLAHASDALSGDVHPATASLYIVNPFGGEVGAGLLRLFSTHPATAERIRRLLLLAGHQLPRAGAMPRAWRRRTV